MSGGVAADSPGAVRVVVGVPVRGAEHLERALLSIVGQTATGLSVVVVDDSDDGACSDVARRLLTGCRDLPSCVERPEARLGLVRAWRRCLALARELHPELELFAWGSDHDEWAPEFVERLAAALVADPGAVLAYPLVGRVGGAGPTEPWRFDTATSGVAGVRLAHVVRRMRAGDMVYGLFRADALERAGGLRDVLLPDRLLLAELALAGRFVQVPEVLWRRRLEPTGEATLARQRRRLFPGDPPFTARVPWRLAHAAQLARARGVGRGTALGAAVAYPVLDAALALARLLVCRGVGLHRR